MSLFASRADTAEFRRRHKWLALVVLIGFAVISVRLFVFQVFDADKYKALARENVIRRTTLATTRGVIRDRFGRVLAASRPSYNIYCVPSRLDMNEVWPKLVEHMGLSVSERDALAARIVELRSGHRKDWQILLKEDVSRDTVAVLETHSGDLRGVEVVPTPVRYYPYKEVGAQVLGYMSEVDADLLMRLRSIGYLEGDRRGAAGVERSWESYLRGRRGWEKVVVDARGRRRSTPEAEQLVDEPKRRDPVPGRDIRLTIDLDIQQAIHVAMRPHLAGAVVVVEVRTGRVLGMVSKPSYDPNDLSGGNGKAALRTAFRRAINDPLHPMLDKTMSGAYPPGSTFKPFTALAALNDGLLDPRQGMRCRGFHQFGNRVFKCTHVHGNVDLQKSLVESCNVYYYLLGERIGMDRIAKVGLDFGFGHKTGLGTNPETAGRMPTRAWYAQHYRQFRLGYTLNAAIGQGATTVSVLQLALAYAALSNGGTLFEPQIVRAVETADGMIVQDFTPRVRRRVNAKPEDIALLHRGLWGVVNMDFGTANKERLAGIDVAGKTGTAQVSHRAAKGGDDTSVWFFNRDHAWFSGYAPASAPEIAVVVIIEHGGAGGRNAAPVVFQVARAFEQLKAERAAKGVTDDRRTMRGGGP